MSSLTPQQRRANAIQFGRAIVKIIKGAEVLLPGSRRIEHVLLKAVLWLYRPRLRAMIGMLLADVSAEILAASDNITGPVGDVNLN